MYYVVVFVRYTGRGACRGGAVEAHPAGAAPIHHLLLCLSCMYTYIYIYIYIHIYLYMVSERERERERY